MSMIRAQYDRRGTPPQDVIRPISFEPPKLEPGQALVEVLAAPINPSDVLTLTGEYGILPPLPAVGGSEGVGRVVELAPDTQGPAVGQTVLLPAGSGTWTTHQVADAARLIPLPNDADPLQLSMMTVNPPTALLLLREFVSLSRGDWVIQNAANSGVGGYLAQIAALNGYRTVNVVRRASAIEGVKALGGDVVLVDGDDLAERVSAATGKAPIRLGIDAVGGGASARLAECLAEGATQVSYGAMSGEACQLSPRSFIFQDIHFRGFWLARWFRTVERDRQVAVLGEVAQLLASGKLRARIQATFDVSLIRDAIALAASGEREGKILIVPHRA
ncbi:zinc-dependent alcohol dehydrogenase family protein [Niveibacterium sp. SC-1]|uniref:zinc-dependent alcohol dehydrogenase family protein n=1 Tax=Niveibacterium sp. SC-1 TaxID=3135646 RepID=UPI00311E51B0